MERLTIPSLCYSPAAPSRGSALAVPSTAAGHEFSVTGSRAEPYAGAGGLQARCAPRASPEASPWGTGGSGLPNRPGESGLTESQRTVRPGLPSALSSMALSVGVRRLSDLPGRGERQVQLSFRGGQRGREAGWVCCARAGRSLTPPLCFPRLHPEDKEDPLWPGGCLWGGERVAIARGLWQWARDGDGDGDAAHLGGCLVRQVGCGDGTHILGTTGSLPAFYPCPAPAVRACDVRL